LTVSHQSLPSHPGGSRAFRLDWSESGQDRSLAYITDTSADGSYTEFIRGGDLLVHECYFKDEMLQWGKLTGHCCTSQVAKLAAEAGVGRLVLTHIDPQHPEDDPIDLQLARSIFSEVELAEDLGEYDV
jgi:ribonuclease BN (tRNA processing enzyme)